MTATADQVLLAALALPEKDRLLLVDALLASFTDGDQPFDASWHEVIERRSAELSAGDVVPVPWEEVKRRTRAGE